MYCLRRIFAFAIDQLIVLSCFVFIEKTGLLSLPSFWEPYVGDYDLTMHRISFKLVFMFIASGWLYAALFECSPLQASIGKFILRLYVADRKDKRISFPRSTARQLCSILVLFIFILETVLRSFESSMTGSESTWIRLRSLPQDALTETQVLKRSDTQN